MIYDCSSEHTELTEYTIDFLPAGSYVHREEPQPATRARHMELPTCAAARECKLLVVAHSVCSKDEKATQELAKK